MREFTCMRILDGLWYEGAHNHIPDFGIYLRVRMNMHIPK